MIKLTEKDILRFWAKVDVKGNLDECWEWQASVNIKNGYGIFGINKKNYSSHRIVWILENGQIPEDDSYFKTLHVLHKCDNPSCCNPHHLFLGTQKDNMKDKSNKNRQLNGEKHGVHKLTEQQVLEIRQKYIPRIYSQYKLAEEYNISRPQISFIVNNKQWKHI